MPQLDFSNPLMLGQVVWLVIIFAALYWVAARLALPKVGRVLELRAAAIARDLEAARDAKTQADAAVAELTAASRDAQQAAAARIADATERSRAEAARRAAEENSRVELQLRDAEDRIGAARTAALNALRDVAADTTVILVGRLLGRSPERREAEMEVDHVLAARAQR